MPRIAPIAPPYADEVRTTFTKLMPPGMAPLKLFATLAHNPRVLRRIQRGGLLDPGSVDTRLRELAILRTCFRCGASYEWGVHAALFGAAAGLDAAALAATWQAELDTHDWTDQERLVLRLCDELHASATIGDDLWRELDVAFREAQLIELITLAGLYHAVSFIVNATGVEAEGWAVAPPDSGEGSG